MTANQTSGTKLVQEYVGVPETIAEQARQLAAELGLSASEVLREMIVVGRIEAIRRLRARADELSPAA
jgi:hypothetical protein